MKNKILLGALFALSTIVAYGSAAAAINVNFYSYCSGSTSSTPGNICDDSHSVAIDTAADQQLLQLNFTTIAGTCASARFHIFVDGLLVKTTGYLGYPGATGAFSSLPLTTGFIPLQVVRPGTHLISLKPELQPGGCAPTGKIAGGVWGGNLQILP